ncbi:MAG: hypothetical protein K8S00_06250, partial [Bacteroidales bacterium]|nr:hypothetical protein [Bacteroidales bacterium]
MKRIIIIALITAWNLAFSVSVRADSTNSITENDTASNPYWIEMMQERDANFFEIQRAFNIYWENREITKGCGWKPFKRWENYWQTRVLTDGSFPSSDKNFKAFMEYSNKHKSVSGDWS